MRMVVLYNVRHSIHVRSTKDNIQYQQLVCLQSLAAMLDSRDLAYNYDLHCYTCPLPP